MWVFCIQYGGAGGYRTRVQKVTDYSSTGIVCLKLYNSLNSKTNRNVQFVAWKVFPASRHCARMQVSNINITPLAAMLPCSR